MYLDGKSEKSDQELVAITKENPDNYRFLMERYQGVLFRFVRRITQLSDEDVEDILQEAFVKMYRNLNGYDPGLKFSSWAYRISHNAAIDHLRRMNVRPKSISVEENDYIRLIPSNENISDEVGRKDMTERIAKALKALPIKYREVLVLRFIEDKSYEEIMDILKKPKGSVATLIDRGRKILAEQLEVHRDNQI